MFITRAGSTICLLLPLSDGSSYYKIHHNYCVFGGHKSDFDGNSKISSYNLAVFPSVYGSKW